MQEPIEVKLNVEQARKVFGETIQLPEEIKDFLDKVEAYWQERGHKDAESTNELILTSYLTMLQDWKELRKDLGYLLTDDEVYPIIEEQLSDLGEIEEGETALLILPAQVSREQQDRVTAQIYADYTREQSEVKQ